MKINMPDPEVLNEYYKTYLKYVKSDDLLASLEEQKKTTAAFLAGIDPAKETFRYAENKWSVREIAGHLCDTERILSYRALRFARRDETELSGFEENDYTANSNYNNIPLSDIIAQLTSIRESVSWLFRSFPEKVYDRKGVANHTVVSVRDILFFIIGHQEHHLKVIRERYLAL